MSVRAAAANIATTSGYLHARPNTSSGLHFEGSNEAAGLHRSCRCGVRSQNSSGGAGAGTAKIVTVAGAGGVLQKRVAVPDMTATYCLPAT